MVAAVTRHWNAAPTPFQQEGKRMERRRRQHEKHHRLGGLEAYTREPIRCWVRATYGYGRGK